MLCDFDISKFEVEVQVKIAGGSIRDLNLCMVKWLFNLEPNY